MKLIQYCWLTRKLNCEMKEWISHLIDNKLSIELL